VSVVILDASSQEAVVSEPSRAARPGHQGPVVTRRRTVAPDEEDRDRRADGRPEQGRPRDRTGRPLPYGTSGVALAAQSRPASVEQALELGVRRWQERRYFEAHELLELAWRKSPEQDRGLWKGVIQVAAAGVHLQRGNPTGARRLLGRALDLLSLQPDIHRGVDVRTLRGTAESARALLEAGGRPDADWGPFPSCSDGVADGVWFASTADATGPADRPTALP